MFNRKKCLTYTLGLNKMFNAIKNAFVAFQSRLCLNSNLSCKNISSHHQYYHQSQHHHYYEHIITYNQLYNIQPLDQNEKRNLSQICFKIFIEFFSETTEL